MSPPIFSLSQARLTTGDSIVPATGGRNNDLAREPR
jgi:hypothetical protein